MNLRVGVLALQGDVREHRQMLAEVGVDAPSVRTPEELKAVEALVIPGGESTTMSLLAQRLEMLEPLRAAVAAGMPMFGSCAGMIMLANEVLDGRPDQQTLGALDMTVRRNAFGRQVDSFEAEVSVPAIGSPDFPAVFIRAPWVESIGSDVEVLASVPGPAGEERIIAVRSGATIATSFHPEITGDNRIHRMFVDIVASS